MVTVGLSELKSLHSGLSSKLSWQKFEKYVLIVTASIVFSQIPFKVVDNDVICCERYDRDAVTWEHFLKSHAPQFSQLIWRRTICIWSNSHGNDDSDSEDSTVHERYQCSHDNNTKEMETGEITEDKITSDSLEKLCPRYTETCDEIKSEKPPMQIAQCTAREKTSVVKTSNINASRREKNSKLSEKETVTQPRSAPKTSAKPDDKGESECNSQSKQGMSSCKGQRAKFIAVSLSITLLIFIGLLMAHDVWIERSGKEIDELKNFVRMKSELQICDNCARKLLESEFKGMCGRLFNKSTKLKDFCEDCTKTPLTLIQNCTRQTLLKNPPKMKYIDRRYFWQNLVGIASLVLALFVFNNAVSYNYEGYECRIGTHQYVACHDRNREIVKSAMYIVWTFTVILTISALCKMYGGPPYTSLLYALKSEAQK